MNILLIEKNETINEKNVKSIDIEKLYTVCGYRSNKDFQKLYQWEFDNNVYELYGKKNGKSDKENKYKFPIERDRDKDRDIDNNKHKMDKYYGTLCIIKKNGSITIDEWNIFYMSFTTKYDKDYTYNKHDTHDTTYTTDSDTNTNVDDENNDNHIKYLDDELTYEEYEEE